MAGATGRIPLSHRILTLDNPEIECSRDPAMNLSGTVFEFLEEEGQRSPESVSSDGNYENEGLEEDEEGENSALVEDNNKNFWENQHQLLQATVRRTTFLESRIRQATKDALKQAQMTENSCSCWKPVAGGCRNCLMKEVCGRLQNVGFNCAICKSKWRSSTDIPSVFTGQHTFLDVLDSSNPKKGEVRVIIELNLRAEFEMAKAGDDYNGLIEKLPEVFVGKVERLLSMIKILCSAAKKSMKEKKMHMGPWRRQKYMQAKWLRTCERMASTVQPVSMVGFSSRSPTRPRASMLTVDLLEILPNVHRAAVQVV